MSVISAGQREKPDQATHVVRRVQNHRKMDLIQFIARQKLHISTLSFISNVPAATLQAVGLE